MAGMTRTLAAAFPRRSRQSSSGMSKSALEKKGETIPDEIWQLAQPRQAARMAKNWAEADALRAQITAAGYEVQDTPDGPQVRPLMSS